MTPNRRVKRSSYGGDSGVWIRKRRVSDRNNLNATPRKEQQASFLEESKDGDNETITARKQPIGDIPPSSVQSDITNLIVWDDVLCRPVYRKPQLPPQLSVPQSPSFSEDEEDIATEDMRRQQWTQTGSTRTYGSKRQKAPLVATAIGNSPDRIANEKEKARHVVTPDLDYDPDGGVTHEKFSVCTSLQLSNTETHEYPLSNNSRVGNDVCELKNKKSAARSQCNKTSKMKLSGQGLNIDELRARGKSQQPKPHTSLSVARAFFAKLDSTPLPLGNEFEKSDDNHNASIRTVRVKEMNEQVTKEYDDYFKKCREAGYPPLTLREFVNHKGTHFGSTKPGSIEGFLDEM
eukprot:CAMPEP_0172485268 /NCGR_PEP_ID=MMETSP1066-20121228/13221_1 /TAXON_ID=671091 /ORGANISM="Coscinodiscus wailesii, Strain CCMP2513" /LENGTH=347 /DNA_ID=CAMNT_0013250411 /DNA_START=155 /DNA_END=1198 /DNA_ORIENTATION=+